MKREEAIAILDISKTCHGVSGRKYDEAIDMAIEALQGDMYCPNCGVRLVPEDEYIEPTPTHGRLIDADALYASIAKDTYLLTDRINSRDYGMFLVGIKKKIDNAPTVQADRPHGEWIETSEGTMCSNCHKFPYDDGEYHIANWHSNFCHNCGADMRKEKK